MPKATPEREQQDLEIEPQRPVADVVEIAFQARRGEVLPREPLT